MCAKLTHEAFRFRLSISLKLSMNKYSLSVTSRQCFTKNSDISSQYYYYRVSGVLSNVISKLRKKINIIDVHEYCLSYMRNSVFNFQKERSLS